MIKTCAIASGSNGNCYYIEYNEDAILIDAGISAKQILARMKKLNLHINKIKGIFISHEHSDHIQGAEVISKKLNIPVYITEKTFTNSNISLNNELINFITPNKCIDIGKLQIIPFTKLHDAVEPCSFSIMANNKKIVVMTDLGNKCENVIKHIQDSNVIFLESNYDEEMLENGRYPAYLKKRISSDLGHLSNYQAGLLILEHATPKLKHVFLSHLSENNNKPELAYNTFNSLIKERKDLCINVMMTSRYEESKILCLK